SRCWVSFQEPSIRGAQPKKTDRESMSHRGPYAAWPHCSRNIEAFRSSRVDWNWEYRCADVCQLVLPSLSSGVCTGVMCTLTALDSETLEIWKPSTTLSQSYTTPIRSYRAS